MAFVKPVSLKTNTAMKKGFFLLFFLIGITSVIAQDNVSIKLSNLPAQTKAGERFTVIAEISCPTPMSQRVWATVKFPEGWQIIAKKVPPRLVGLTNARFVYTISVGKYATAGKREVSVMVFKNGLESFVEHFTTKVSPIYSISVTNVNPPAFIKEGETLRSSFLVHNAGNVQENLRLETSQGFIEGYERPIVIEPNRSTKITVVQVIPKIGGESWLATADLKLVPSDSARKPIYHVVSIPVFSTKTKPIDPYHRFPIEAGAWYNIVSRQGSYTSLAQYDIRGKGFIDPTNKHRLEFIIHGPDQIDLPILGAYDQYSVSYTYDTTNIQLGDYSLMFSKIMEQSRFGRGVKIERENNGKMYSAFYQRPRFISDIKETLGGSYAFRSRSGFKTSFNYMSKNMLFNGRSIWSHHIGVGGALKTKQLTMEHEVAANSSNGKLDVGLYSMVNYAWKRVFLTNLFLYAGKNYFGFFNNGWQFVNNVTFQVTPKLTVGLFNNYSRISPSFDLLNINTSPFTKSSLGIISYSINKNWKAILNAGFQAREDRQQVKKFNYRENLARLMVFLTTKNMQLWATGELSNTQNLLVPPDLSIPSYSYRGILQNEFYLTSQFSLGLNGEFYRTNKFSSDNIQRDYLYYGGLIRYRVKNLLDFNLNYRNNYAPDELIVRRDFFSLQAKLDLGNHRFTAMGMQTYIPGYSEQNNFILSLQYRYLFNIAVAKVKNLGSIKGQITGASNVKKEGVLVQIGSQKYLTDTDGKFVINNLKPDRYSVSLFRSSMTMNDIPAHQGVLEVEVKADSIHTLEIPFIKAGMIAGKVNYEKGNNPGLAGDKIEKPTVLVKLFNGEDSHLTLANENGEFTFKEIKPGDWKLQATLMMGEGKFSISQPQRDVTVVAEQAKEVTFVVRPVSRTIRFIDRSIQTGSK